MSIVVFNDEGGQPGQANGMKSSRSWMVLGQGDKEGRTEERIKLCKARPRQRRIHESSSTT